MVGASWWGWIGTVGGDDGFTDRASPSTPLPPTDGPPLRLHDGPSRPSMPLHARTHVRTNVTKRDGELRMRTTEKCNTESPAAWRVVTHRSHTHAQTTTIARTTTITLRRVFLSAVEWTRNNIHSTTTTTNIHDDDNRMLKINAI